MELMNENAREWKILIGKIILTAAMLRLCVPMIECVLDN
jgi:hypothetical protein